MPNKKVVLIILDGWGYAPSWGGNAIETAITPNMDNFWRKYPHCTLKAAEEAVGLPHHEPGNSEVGHLNLGSGAIVKQNLPGITATIEDKSFFSNQILLGAIENAQKNNSNLHLMGLVSDGGVHSHISHLFALLDLIKSKNFDRVYIHMFTDGRDTDQMKALSYLDMLDRKIQTLKIGKIETTMGRYYAMDRDNRWERVQKAYDALTSGMGIQSTGAAQAISESYRQGQYDEFIVPTIIASAENPFTPITDNDSIILFNYRGDRAKELTEALVDPKFKAFGRRKVPKNLYFASFAYHEEYENRIPVHVVFRKAQKVRPLAQILSEAKLKQLHLAETEKFAHTTYFFDGGNEKPFPSEDYVMIPSPRVASYDLKPEMSAEKITQTLISKMSSYDFCVVNFANPDMVGHTGNLKAAIKACEAIDECLGAVAKEAQKEHRVLIITADHGNAEQMLNPNTGEPHTEHTINPVPFILISDNPAYQNPLRGENGEDLKLSDVAPTILKIMNIPIPPEMTGKSLIV